MRNTEQQSASELAQSAAPAAFVEHAVAMAEVAVSAAESRGLDVCEYDLAASIAEAISA